MSELKDNPSTLALGCYNLRIMVVRSRLQINARFYRNWSEVEVFSELPEALIDSWQN